MIETPQVVQTQPLMLAKIYARVPTVQIQSEMGKLVQELIAGIRDQNIEITGAWLTHHFRRPDEFFDFEVCMPVADSVQAVGRIQPGEWPAMKAARTVFHGDYEGLPGAWGEFMAWIEKEGLKVSPEIWERYLVNPNSEKDPSVWRTELNRPLI